MSGGICFNTHSIEMDKQDMTNQIMQMLLVEDSSMVISDPEDSSMTIILEE